MFRNSAQITPFPTSEKTLIFFVAKLFKDGLARTSFVTQLRSALSAAGYCPTSYAGHSFRIGAATTAAQAGLHFSVLPSLFTDRSVSS